MNISNKLELKLDKYEKCYLICDLDCPIGQLYDYACYLESFCTQKMKESEECKKQAKEASEAPKE